MSLYCDISNNILMGTFARVVWFLVIGWWLGPLWFIGSLFLMGTIIFFPIGAYTAVKTWSVMTLKTSPQKVVVEAKMQKDD